MKRCGWGVLLALLVAMGVPGCVEIQAVTGSGNIIEEEREASGFSSVDLGTIGKLSIELGDEERLSIEAEDNLIEYFEVSVLDGELKIECDEHVGLFPTEQVYFYLTARELDSLAISGAGSIKAPDLEAGRFVVDISGAGSVDMEDLDADTFEVDISGGGGVDMGDLNAAAIGVNISGLGSMSIAGGTVEEQEIVISGGGNYRARGLESAMAGVQVDGLGSAIIRVRDRLEVTITGGGSVEYIGSPTVEQNVSGVGHVKKIGE